MYCTDAQFTVIFVCQIDFSKTKKGGLFGHNKLKSYETHYLRLPLRHWTSVRWFKAIAEIAFELLRYEKSQVKNGKKAEVNKKL